MSGVVCIIVPFGTLDRQVLAERELAAELAPAQLATVVLATVAVVTAVAARAVAAARAAEMGAADRARTGQRGVDGVAMAKEAATGVARTWGNGGGRLVGRLVLLVVLVRLLRLLPLPVRRLAA